MSRDIAHAAAAWDRFWRTGNLAALDEAIIALRQAAHHTPLDHPGRLAVFARLRAGLGNRFDLTGDLESLDEAIQAGHAAAACLGGRSRASQAGHLNELGLLLQIRFEQRGKAQDLDEAVEFGLAAFAAAHDDATRARCASAAGIALQMLCDRTGNMDDLLRAIELFRYAIVLTSRREEVYLSNVQAALVRWYEWTGDPASLDESLRAGWDAVALPPRSDRTRAITLQSLALALGYEFGRKLDLSILQKAIDANREALHRLPAHYPNRARHLASFAHLLHMWFEQVGAVAALTEGIECYRLALAVTPARFVDRPLMMSNLAMLLRDRYLATRDPAKLDEATSVGRDAATLVTGDHPDCTIVLSGLAETLICRWEEDGDETTLHEASTLLADALDCVRDSNGTRAILLSKISGLLLRRYEKTGDPATIDEAIRTADRAVDMAPATHPTTAVARFNRASIQRALFERTGDLVALRNAIEGYEEAARTAMLRTSARIAAARGWCDLAARDADWTAAAMAGVIAVDLLGHLVTQHVDRRDQELTLAEAVGLASAAAACLLESGGGAQAALELLERGRSVLFARTLATKSDHSELRARRPDLADRFDRLAVALDQPGMRSPSGFPREGNVEDIGREAHRRLELVQGWESLIREIRRVPGQDRFLGPLRTEDLTVAATDGPVVTVNVSPYRCDALVLTRDGMAVVKLPNLTEDKLEAVVTVHDDAVRILSRPDRTTREEASADEGVQHALGFLWRTVTEPVLRHLRIDDTMSDPASAPRIWWLPTGLLSRLPLHAAGLHRDRGDSVMDRAVSSYTPTVRALVYARAKARPTERRRIVVVAMSHTNGHPDLPGARIEADMLADWFGATVLMDRDATRERILAELPDHHWSHFTCHARNKPHNPSRSHFVVHDGALEVSDLSRLKATNGELAYLPSCHTAHGGVVLADEAIHLTSAMQLAGYTHTIGALWPTIDPITARLTAEIYATVDQTGRGVSGLATTLHTAIDNLRQSERDHPSWWAPYVHVGP